jgi:Cu+-exporting ATPase
MKVIDPVCGMELDSETAEHTLEHEGKTYYFCTPLCKIHFRNKPEKFLEESGLDKGSQEAAG